MKDATSAKLLATLRAHNPAKVLAYDGSSDEGRPIAVPTRRRRWAQVIANIEAKPWSRVELVDKSGSVLAYVDNEGSPREVEELAPSFDGVRGQLLLGERIAQLCMSSVSRAVSQRDEETRNLLQAQRDVVKEMSDAVKSLGDVYRAQLDAATDAADTRAEAAATAAASSGEGGLKELMDALPQLLQALPIIKALLAQTTRAG
jgi:hypothetical protein